MAACGYHALNRGCFRAGVVVFVTVHRILRTFIVTGYGEIEITNDPQILRNLNWASPRLRFIHG